MRRSLLFVSSLALVAALPSCDSRAHLRDVTVSPDALAFDPTVVGSSRSLALEVSNGSDHPVQIALLADAPFVARDVSVYLGPGQSAHPTIAFSPVEAGAASGALNIDVAGERRSITLGGIGVAPPECPAPNGCHGWAFDPAKGTCVISDAAADGHACSSPCLPAGVCAQGVCTGTAKDCSDSDLCTSDECLTDGGCGHAPVVCPDSDNPCITTSCDPKMGCNSQNVADGTLCESSGCGSWSSCEAGVCQSQSTATPHCAMPTCADLGLGQLCHNGFCFESPFFGPNLLQAVAGSSPSDVWMVGPSEAFHWNGTTFTTHDFPVDYVLVLAAVGPADVWAFGADATAHWDGSAWTLRPWPGMSNPRAAISVPGDAVYVSDSSGNVYRRSNGAWTNELQINGPIVGFVSQPPALWAMSQTGREYKREAGQWVAQSTQTATTDRYFGSASARYAIQYNKLVRTDLSAMPVMQLTYQVVDGAVSADGSDLWAAESYRVEHLESGKWKTSLGYGSEAGLQPIFRSGVNDVWVAAQDARPAHWDGRDWRSFGCAARTAGVSRIDGRSEDSLWALAGGDALQRTAQGWVSAPILSGYSLTALRVVGPDEAWFGRPGGLLHWKNGGVTNPNLPTNGTISVLWSTASDDVWAVSNTPGVYHWNGSIWTTVQTPTGAQFIQGMWGLGPNDAYAVGGNSTNNGTYYVWHWDGTSWTQVHSQSGNGKALSFIDGTSSNDIWAVGGNGASMVHFEGQSWLPVAGAPPAFIVGMARTGPNELWIVGPNEVARYDGTAWTNLNVNFSPTCLGRIDDGRVWFGGSGASVIARWSP